MLGLVLRLCCVTAQWWLLECVIRTVAQLPLPTCCRRMHRWARFSTTSGWCAKPGCCSSSTLSTEQWQRRPNKNMHTHVCVWFLSSLPVLHAAIALARCRGSNRPTSVLRDSNGRSAWTLWGLQSLTPLRLFLLRWLLLCSWLLLDAQPRAALDPKQRNVLILVDVNNCQ